MSYAELDIYIYLCTHAQDGINNYTCSCVFGYDGVNCQVNIDDCVGTPCQNEGTCIVSI